MVTGTREIKKTGPLGRSSFFGKVLAGKLRAGRQTRSLTCNRKYLCFRKLIRIALKRFSQQKTKVTFQGNLLQVTGPSLPFHEFLSLRHQQSNRNSVKGRRKPTGCL